MYEWCNIKRSPLKHTNPQVTRSRHSTEPAGPKTSCNKKENIYTRYGRTDEHKSRKKTNHDIVTTLLRFKLQARIIGTN